MSEGWIGRRAEAGVISAVHGLLAGYMDAWRGEPSVKASCSNAQDCNGLNGQAVSQGLFFGASSKSVAS